MTPEALQCARTVFDYLYLGHTPAPADVMIVFSASGLMAVPVELDERTGWDQYRLFATYSWISACTTAAMGSRLQPIEVGRRATVRTTDAIADLDTLGLLRDRLTRP